MFKAVTLQVLSRLRFVAACAALAAAPVAADSFRCNNTILGMGSHQYEVSEACGAPLASYQRIEFLHPQVFVQIHEWVYELGDNRFRRLLRFRNSRLESVETLTKPSGPSNAELLERSGERAEHRISF
ncbi:MAG: DUF2845 domain-containing protein [Pseudomonadota bacterium]